VGGPQGTTPAALRNRIASIVDKVGNLESAVRDRSECDYVRMGTLTRPDDVAPDKRDWNGVNEERRR